ncbi:MAG: ATPase, T2SS/T4P/T4SS family [Erysipelotrichaceae bacterium]
MEEEFAKLFRFAIKHEASDIHLTLVDECMTVEVRSPTGMLRYRTSVSAALIRFLKFRADMDLMDSHRPQTGRMNYQFMKRTYALRVAHVRSGNTENIVIRILNPYFTLKFDSLFENEGQKNTMMKMLAKEQGLLLIAGTTGSGKTTTLYQCLSYLIPRKIVTIEDPIEVYLEGIVQLQVNPQKNFGFNEAIKQVLRHDPNVIVIGEIRDEQEAKAAIRVALSGHLVLSTLHANNLAKITTRMRNFGVTEEDLDNALEGIVYQRMEADENGKRKVRFELEIIQ